MLYNYFVLFRIVKQWNRDVAGGESMTFFIEVVRQTGGKLKG